MAITPTTAEIEINHDFKMTATFTSSGPLIKSHNFENTDLNITMAALHKGRFIELYRTD